MRGAFFSELGELARLDSRVTLLVGDLGFGVIEPFVSEFPDRFFNAGVAEQNMTGLATGMALTGSMVFTYSIGNFPTLRCLEQIRNDVCYHHANVKVVAVGGGLAYGALGISHHATEDLAIMRVLPNLMVTAPGDPVEAIAVTRAIGTIDGPAYLRLNKAGESLIHDGPLYLPPGASVRLHDGGDVALLVTGGMLETAVRVTEILTSRGINVQLTSMPWLAPFDDAAVALAAEQTGLVVTLEEHSVIGGLGGAVAEVVSGLSKVAPLLRIGLPRSFSAPVGGQSYLRRYHGLDEISVAERIENHLSAESKRCRQACASEG